MKILWSPWSRERFSSCFFSWFFSIHCFSIVLWSVFSLLCPSKTGASPAKDLVSGLSPSAVSKVDPRLVFALSSPRSESALRAVSRMLPLSGESRNSLEFDVLIRSTLSDAELASLGAHRSARIGNIVTARLTEAALLRVASDPRVNTIESEPRLTSTLDRSAVDVRAYTKSGDTTTGYTGEGVIFGLIDDGLDLTHLDFKDSAGNTRVLSVWDQAGVGIAPSGFDYGVEYTSAQIDAGSATSFENSLGHGTHVAGIGAGDGSAAGSPFRGLAPAADIIVVANTNPENCDLFCYGGGVPWPEPSSRGSIDALVYLQREAEILGKPLVINQSQGVMMGPHDGTTLFEQTYNQLIEDENVIVVVAAGNDQASKWHGSTTVPPGGSEILTLSHDADRAQQVVLFELWWDAGQRYQLTLTSPSGDRQVLPLNTGGVRSATTSQNDEVLYFSTQQQASNGQGQALFLIRNENRAVESGDWEVSLQSQSGSTGRVHVYCERNQGGLAVDEPDRTAIVGMPATADHVIAVGSYNIRFDWESVVGSISLGPDRGGLHGVSSFSSQGPRRDGILKPDIAAPGQWIASALSRDFNVQPELSHADGAHVMLRGTSMSAPHVSGTIALMLEKDPSLGFAEVKQILRSTAREDADTGTTPNAQFGAGRLDVKAAVDAVVKLPECELLGDINGNGDRNVVDVVAVVNHLVGSKLLSKVGRVCANVDGSDFEITIRDVAALVDLIVNEPAPARQVHDEGPASARATFGEVAWKEQVDDAAYQLRFESEDVAGLQMSFVLPRGYETRGDPYLVGTTASFLQWRESLGVHHLVALPSQEGAFGVVIPVQRIWEGGQTMADFSLERVLLSGEAGCPLILASDARNGDGPEETKLNDYLLRAVPNPLQDHTMISYQVPRSGQASLAIFDAQGRRVRTLLSGYQSSGSHLISWNRLDSAGREVPAGVYFARLTTKHGADRQKIHVVR